MRLDLEIYPSLLALVSRQLEVFPDHRAFLQKRFSTATFDDLQFSEEMAEKILRIAGTNLTQICRDYKWMSEMMLEEELHFRRTGRYRLSTFEDANIEVYSNHEFMTRYMNGLLASQIWWRNHTEVLHFFRDRFVKTSLEGLSHVDIGPGHGLFLHLAVSSSRYGSAQGWDVSQSSLDGTRLALDALGSGESIELKKVDFLAAPRAKFQSIVFSEVLEHLEEPRKALASLYNLLADDGRLFINAPVNSPAPDHLYLFRTPEEIVEMVENAGFKVVETLFAPCTGASVERARKLNLTISTAIIAAR